MCGIAGIWLRSPVHAESLADWVRGMAAAMQHRGPDGRGLWLDQSQGLALAHARLSIRDLQDSATQPMLEPSGCGALVFNGEIDNHAQWRREWLRQGYSLGHSEPQTNRMVNSSGDTEALLHALQLWGPERTCRSAQGMWAWAWYDRIGKRLTLSRDRMGKKPLYWVQGEWGVAFASQLQAFRHLPLFVPQVHPPALSHYLRWGFMEGPDTLLQGVQRVEPGQLLRFEEGRFVSKTQYWKVDDEVLEAQHQRINDPMEAATELISVLKSAVADRLNTDVRTGAFLSGGVDSALVVSLMRELGASAQTWCVGFDDPRFDETDRARSVANSLGTHHETIHVTGRLAREWWPDLARLMDEPMADASLIPTAILAQHAAKSVKVVMTGDGGDEAFGGYARYRLSGPWMRRLASLPQGLRMGLARSLEGVEPHRWNQLVQWWPTRWRPTLPASKAEKMARWLRAHDDLARVQVGLIRWDPQLLWPDAPADSPFAQTLDGVGSLGSEATLTLAPSERLQRFEMAHYLSGDLLAKMDRATMWSSLEARSPLLDHRVVALAWRCSPRCKAEGPRLKEVLRLALERYLPRAVFDVPKRGFTPPLDRWLRAELRAPAIDLLESLWGHTRGRWNDSLMRQAWSAQQGGTRIEVDRIWTLLTLELWRREWGLELP